MYSFNFYGQTSETIGGNTPVWLGTVRPIPVGAIVGSLESELAVAGTAVAYDSEEKVAYVLKTDELANANAFLYNDVRRKDSLNPDEGATCAVVMHHPEGLLIERVYPDITKEQIEALQAKIPGVLLVRG